MPKLTYEFLHNAPSRVRNTKTADVRAVAEKHGFAFRADPVAKYVAHVTKEVPTREEALKARKDIDVDIKLKNLSHKPFKYEE